MTMMKHFVIQEVEPRKPADGVEIRPISGERMTMAFFHLAPGSKMPEHSHPHEQIGTVLKGSVTLVIGGEETLIEAGGAYIIPPNVTHGGRCGDTATELIEVFSPVREDLK
ncbi:MAG: cupin domain-containing protein [Deltaproteobacteria bacterium]|nr:cupin domain-containing protein [Deltaproteobacteria bacterium]MBW2128533.1 cupin domain-containing protein [Deltaproteobacteria bacterium]MBW2303343.1 cupin domain-containing protein [Deltaproteobacteria bacterium]